MTSRNLWDTVRVSGLIHCEKNLFTGPGRAHNKLQEKAVFAKTRTLNIVILLLAALAILSDVCICEEKVLSPRLVLNPSRLYPGDFLVIFLEGVEPNDKVSLQTNLPQTTLKAYPYREGLISLVGMDYRTPPGEYYILARVTGKEPGVWQENLKIVLESKRFASQYLQVSPKKLEARIPEKWQQDLPHTQEARSRSSDLPLWEERFLAPLKGRKTTDFGPIRYINGKEVGRHSGVDIAAPRGTLVIAANSGVVCLARFLNVTGYTVIVDHGLNLFTSYCHLESLLVEKGQKVVRGHGIGRVGSSGFATGPHLHWGAVIGSTFIDPHLLVKKNPLDMLDGEIK